MPAVKVLSWHTLKYISGEKTDHFCGDASENIGRANKNIKKKRIVEPCNQKIKSDVKTYICRPSSINMTAAAASCEGMFRV